MSTCLDCALSRYNADCPTKCMQAMMINELWSCPWFRRIGEAEVSATLSIIAHGGEASISIKNILNYDNND